MATPARNVIDLTAETPPVSSHNNTIHGDDEDDDVVVLENEDEEVDDDTQWHFLLEMSAASYRYVRIVGTRGISSVRSCASFAASSLLTLAFTSTGIRYYRGVAHPGEYVTLVREPSNPYDRNAIRVDNMRGEKVGHIKRELAAVLSPVMASHGDRLKVDATIPGPGNQFELPLTLHLYSSTPSDGSIETKLACLAANPTAALKRAAAAVAVAQPSSASSPAVVVQARTMDWKLQQKHLDELFEAQRQEQLANLPDLEVPKCLVSALLEHQWTGVRWLVSREKSQDRPFWETVTENGSTKWLCEVTKSSQPQPPRQVKGSILADDMGLVRLQTTLVLAGIARVALALTISLPIPGTLSNLFRGRRFRRLRSSSLILPQGETITPQSSHRRLH
jgi:HIRAN domain/SNF2-related domain